MVKTKRSAELRNTVVEEIDGSEGAKMREDLKVSKAADRTPVPSPTAEAPEKERVVRQRVRAEVFARATGIRADQSAGFLYHVKKQKLGARSIQEWKELWDAFMNRPVK